MRTPRAPTTMADGGGRRWRSRRRLMTGPQGITPAGHHEARVALQPVLPTGCTALRARGAGSGGAGDEAMPPSIPNRVRSGARAALTYRAAFRPPETAAPTGSARGVRWRSRGAAREACIGERRPAPPARPPAWSARPPAGRSDQDEPWGAEPRPEGVPGDFPAGRLNPPLKAPLARTAPEHRCARAVFLVLLPTHPSQL